MGQNRSPAPPGSCWTLIPYYTPKIRTNIAAGLAQKPLFV